MNQNGKGDSRRPLSTNWEKFSQNWDDIFKKKVPEPKIKVDESYEFPKKKFSKKKN